ncbi:MAG: SPOR domain-containing protein [Bryobacterales bacterium]|nr:SPOR domain-containing protein [Bryobacterales bacterium]
MARRSRTKAADQIEVVFGFKQVLGLILFSVAALGLTFVGGVEHGHKRSQRGDPSLLAFLEKQADAHTEPVAIPEVLLEQLEEERAKVKAASEAERSAASGQEREPIERVKPSAAVKARPAAEQVSAADAPAEKPPSDDSPAADEPKTAAREPAPRPKAALGKQLHYQVAALNSRKNAKGLVDWLRAQGFPGYIQPAGDDGLYRVVVGPFPNDREAESAKVRLAQDGFAVMVRKL